LQYFKDVDAISNCTIIAVCPPDTGGSFYQFAQSQNIPCLTAPANSLKGWNLPETYDIGLVASFGYFISSRIIESFSKGILNAHPSLLPKYRGASPIQYTIMNGDQYSGVSIIDLDSKHFDAGNIWLQEQVVETIMQLNFRPLNRIKAITNWSKCLGKCQEMRLLKY